MNALSAGIMLHNAERVRNGLVVDISVDVADFVFHAVSGTGSVTDERIEALCKVLSMIPGDSRYRRIMDAKEQYARAKAAYTRETEILDRAGNTGK